MIFNIFTEDTSDVAPARNPGAQCTPFHVNPSSHTHDCGNRILAALVCLTIRSLFDFMIVGGIRRIQPFL